MGSMFRMVSRASLIFSLPFEVPVARSVNCLIIIRILADGE